MERRPMERRRLACSEREARKRDGQPSANGAKGESPGQRPGLTI
jgi:hypothetical protein